MKHLLSLILLTFISIILFSNTLKNSFVWEDKFTIIENRYIRNIKNISYLFSTEFWKHYLIAQGQYRPVRETFFALDYFLWKLNPFGYHLTNLSLHILNVILIYFLIYGMEFQKPLSTGGEGKGVSVAFLAALFFASHPIHVESVTWIKNRSDLLSFLFFLLSFLFFVRYRLPKGGRHSLLSYFGALICFILALFSKEMAITLPFILILYIVCFLHRGEYKKTITNTLPFFVLMILYLVFKKTVMGALFSSKNVCTIDVYSHILIIVKTIGCYLKLLILPLNLNAERFFSVPRSFFEPAVFSSIAVLLFLFIIIIKTFRYSKLLFFAILWILLTVFPASNIIFLGGRPIAEQRLYIPSLGFCLLIAMGIKKLFFLKIRLIPWELSKTLTVLFSVFILTFYSFTVIKRNLDWRDPLIFWSKTVESSPNSFRAHNNLGVVCNNMGKNEEAIVSYKKALELYPDYADAHYNLGVAYEDMGKNEDAIALYKKALELNPDYIDAYYNLGNIYYVLGRKEDAMALFKAAIKINPRYPKAYNNLGAVYRDLGEYEKALKYLQKAIELDPDYAEAYYNLGLRHDSLGLYQEAAGCYQKAIELDPELVQAYNNLGAAYCDLGEYQKAVIYLKKAISRKPDFVLARKNLARAYYDQKLFSLARSQWEKVLEIEPDNTAAKENLEKLKNLNLN